MMSDYGGIPDYVERKGSLFMRSDHMNYSRATLNSNWHQAREAEPRDYNISKAPTRDLCKATYHRIGNVTDGSLPQTTYQESSKEVFTRKEFTEDNPHKPMINEDTCGHANLDRDTGSSQKGRVLPHHDPEYNKCHFETTHLSDFKPPHPYTPAEEKPLDFADYSLAYKKCHSQFSDTADHRRNGRNTWQDESGIYSNSHLKAQVPVYQFCDPIRKAFTESPVQS